MPRPRRTLLALMGGPLAGAGLPAPTGWPWPTPPGVLLVSRNADNHPVALQPDEHLVDLVAARAAAGGLGWVPYRRAGNVPVELGGAAVWRYEWDRETDPAEQRRLRALG